MNQILEIQNIVKNYSNHLALDDVSISVPKGLIFGLLGPNGAGKTSLIRIITQITAPDSGRVFFDGESLKEAHRNHIGYLPEERGLYKKMKVGDHLLYLAQIKGLSKSEALDKLKGWFIKFDIKSWWEKPVEALSKGMQQKIQFVATVLHQPKLIILDEPFSGFDPINANIIKNEILELRKQGSSIIFSTHRMESVEELCDHVALIDKSKKVLDGSKKDLKEQFKTNSFMIEHLGELGRDGEVYEVLESEKLEDGLLRTRIKLREGYSNKALIQSIIDRVELRAFNEKIPSMNEIFIQVVKAN